MSMIKEKVIAVRIRMKTYEELKRSSKKMKVPFAEYLRIALYLSSKNPCSSRLKKFFLFQLNSNI